MTTETFWPFWMSERWKYWMKWTNNLSDCFHSVNNRLSVGNLSWEKQFNRYNRVSRESNASHPVSLRALPHFRSRINRLFLGSLWKKILLSTLATSILFILCLSWEHWNIESGNFVLFRLLGVRKTIFAVKTHLLITISKLRFSQEKRFKIRSMQSKSGRQFKNAMKFHC